MVAGSQPLEKGICARSNQVRPLLSSSWDEARKGTFKTRMHSIMSPFKRAEPASVRTQLYVCKSR